MPKIILDVSEGQLIELKKLLYLYKTDNYVRAVLQAIYEVMRLGRPTPRALDACPVCFGDQYLIWNDGLLHPCPACNGTGKRQ